jgi:TolA-binding protein
MKIVFLSLFILSLQYAHVLLPHEINTNQYALQISANKHLDNIHATIKRLKNENLYYEQIDGLYKLFVVNLATHQLAKKKKYALREIAKDAIIKKNLHFIKESRSINPSDILNVVVEVEMDVKSEPNHNAHKLYRLQHGEIVKIIKINNEWAQIVDGGGFFPLITGHSTSNTITPQIRAAYSEALDDYNHNNYDQAYKKFNRLFEQAPQNNNINFYLGLSAFAIGDFDTASLSFNRILINEPNAKRVKLELAKVYIEQNKDIEARRLLQQVRETNPPVEVVQNIDKHIKFIDNRSKQHHYKATLSAGIYYDSNIYNRSEDNTFNIPVFGDLDFTNTTKDLSSTAHEEMVALQHKYTIDPITSIKNDLLLFNRGFNKHSDANVKFASYAPALSVLYSNKYLVDYGLFADKLWYGGEGYVKSYGIHPKLNYLLSNQTLLNTHLRYQKKKNLINEQRDSRVVEANIGVQHKATATTTYRPSITVANERKDSGVLTNIDRNSLQASLAATNQVTKELSLTPTISLKHTNYSDEDTLYLKHRKDNELQAGLNAAYTLDNGVVFSGGYNYTANNSNIDYAKYNKYSAALNVKKSF